MRPTDRTRKHRADEKRFPVRVRVVVPDGGFVTCGPNLYPWLDDKCGRFNWAFHPAYQTSYPVDSVYVYFSDMAVASEFLEAFNLETLEVVGHPAPDSKMLGHLHGVPGGNRTRRRTE